METPGQGTVFGFGYFSWRWELKIPQRLKLLCTKIFTLLRWKKHATTQAWQAVRRRCREIYWEGGSLHALSGNHLVTTRGHFYQDTANPTVLLLMITGGLASRPLKDQLLWQPGVRPVEQPSGTVFQIPRPRLVPALLILEPVKLPFSSMGLGRWKILASSRLSQPLRNG